LIPYEAPASVIDAVRHVVAGVRHVQDEPHHD
jgi:hypothetical protein